MWRGSRKELGETKGQHGEERRRRKQKRVQGKRRDDVEREEDNGGVTTIRSGARSDQSYEESRENEGAM